MKRKNLKICIVIPRMGGGGAERVTAHVANKLVERNIGVTLVTFVSSESFYKLDSRIRFISAMCEISRKSTLKRKISMLSNCIRAKKFLDEIVNQEKPDIVLSMLTTADIITYFVKKQCKHHQFKWISSERALPAARNKIYQRFLNRIYTKTDAFVCQSQKMYDYYKILQVKRIIPNPLSTNELPDVKSEEYPLRIVAAGRLDEQKNFSMLIDAFSLAKKELKNNITLTIYGEGHLRDSLYKTIADYGLQMTFFLPEVFKIS